MKSYKDLYQKEINLVSISMACGIGFTILYYSLQLIKFMGASLIISFLVLTIVLQFYYILLKWFDED